MAQWAEGSSLPWSEKAVWAIYVCPHRSSGEAVRTDPDSVILEVLRHPLVFVLFLTQ